MKTIEQYLKFSGVTIFILINLIGCITSPVTPNQTPLVLTTLTETTAPQTSEQVTTTAEWITTLSTVTISATMIAPGSPTPTATPTAHPTPTLAPTMTGDQERVFVIDKLGNTERCSLPCWWGVTPGETKWINVRDFLASLGKEWDNYRYSNGRVDHGTRSFDVKDGKIFFYNIRHTFVEQDGIVQSIEINSECHAPTCDVFLEDWQPYSYHQVVQKYGKPSHVFIQFVPPMEMGAVAYYEFTLVYEDFGFYVHYLGTAVVDSPVIKFCTGFTEVTTIRLFLQSPQSETSIVERFGDTHQLEEVTELTVDDLYNALMKPSEKLCIESTLNKWP
ncbi:MAG: hypothetical protein JXA21_29450 [Anaerolineae bacterium]|nr:hypothetical protein [Anaerolineae bacterium]